MKDADEAVDVARMQADARFIEDVERVDQRSAQRRGEIDALDFAAAERARLAVEREVAEPNIHEVTEARTNFGKQKIVGFVERRGQFEFVEEFVDNGRSAGASPRES